jgi:filamentous hemagglutinin
VIPGTASAPNSQGVYSARIEVADPSNPGQFLAKTNGNPPGTSTMFPNNWSADRIKVEVDFAFANKTPIPGRSNMWQGVTPSGVKVEGYLTPKVTVYPKM